MPTIHSTRNHAKSLWGLDDKPPMGSWVPGHLRLHPLRIVEKVSVPRALEADGSLRLFLKARGGGLGSVGNAPVPEAFLIYL